MDVNREIEVSGDRLRREFPSPKGRVKPLFWTSKPLSDRVNEGGKYNLKRIVEAQHDEKGEWKFLCELRGFDSNHNNWEPAHSFVHGYTKGFIDFLKKHPEIGVLLTDCLSKPDRQVEEEEKGPVVNRDPAFNGLICHIPGLIRQSPLLRSGQPRSQMGTELRVLPLIYSAQAVPVPDQKGLWSHAFVLGLIEEGIPRLECRRQEGDRGGATGGLQEGDRAATGWRQGDDREATGNKT